MTSCFPLGVTRRIILHYEERGLIEPDKRDDATNNRYYTIDTFTKLRSIRSLQNLGLTLDEIRDYYNDSTDLMPLIRRMEEMRDQLNLNIEKLYERAKVSSAQVKELELPQQLIYRRTYRSDNVADKTVLLRNTALEAMRAHGTDITRRMYFIQFPIDRPAELNRRPLRKPDFTVPAGDNSGGHGDRRCAKYHYTIGRMT